MKSAGRLFFLMATLWFSPAFASLEYNARLADAYRHILRLEMDEGNRRLQEERIRNPSNNLVLLYENYADFLKAFLTEEPERFNEFRKNSAKRYAVVENESNDSPWHLFALAEMKLQEAILKIK